MGETLPSATSSSSITNLLPRFVPDISALYVYHIVYTYTIVGVFCVGMLDIEVAGTEFTAVANLVRLLTAAAHFEEENNLCSRGYNLLLFAPESCHWPV
jgi:hypothetical protein